MTKAGTFAEVSTWYNRIKALPSLVEAFFIIRKRGWMHKQEGGMRRKALELSVHLSIDGWGWRPETHYYIKFM